jgi:hypothetical protein
MSGNRIRATHPQHRVKADRYDNPTAGSAVCTGCQAIYHDKHWHPAGQDAALNLGLGDVPETVCPGCLKEGRQEYDGHVAIAGPFIAKHQEEIIGLIRNTEAHVRAHTPIARIAKLTQAADRIEVMTISSLLAELIGKELKKAYDGKLSVQHPEREDFIRVTWFRE